MDFLQADKAFYKGNLHLHTTLSDGRLPPGEAEACYQALGYDFIALTDHWHRGPDAHFCGNMLVLPGMELDFFLINQVVHILGIGIDKGMALVRRGDLAPQSAVNRILEGGGVAILAHPAWSLNTPETICSLRGIAAAEIYNAVSAPPFSGDRADSSSLLDVAAAGGCLLNTVAADDTHFYQGEEGQAFIRLQADSLTQESVMDALRRGAYHASCGPQIHSLSLEGGLVRVTCSPVQHIIFLSNLPWAPKRNFTGEGLSEASYQVKLSGSFPETFLRVIIIDKEGRKAWANPIRLAAAHV